MKTPTRPRRGFTLVELLVGAAVTAVLAGLLVALTTNLLRAWQREEGALGRSREAALALDFLERDLRAAVLRRDGRVWLAATVQPDQTGAGDVGGTSLAAWAAPGAGKPGWAAPGGADSSLDLRPASGRLEDMRFGMAGVWLRLVASVPGDNTSPGSTSAPRAIAYQIVRHGLSGEAGATQRYSLFRGEVRPAGPRSTLAAGHDLFGAAYNNPAVGGMNLGDPGNIRRPRRDQLLANNVIDFGIRVWTRNAGGTLEIAFPRSNANLGFVATVRDGRGPLSPDWGANPALPPAAASAYPYGAAELGYGFPEAVEVLVRVLSEEGARAIEALEDGRGDGRTWWAVAQAHSRVSTRWIPVGGWPP